MNVAKVEEGRLAGNYGRCINLPTDSCRLFQESDFRLSRAVPDLESDKKSPNIRQTTLVTVVRF